MPKREYMKTYCKKYIPNILFSIFLSLAALILNISIASAAPPVPGQIYSGTVTVISSLAGSGATVTAKVNGAQVSSSTTDTSSKYYMMIPGNAGATVTSGATITFYVNGVQATPTATYGSGSLNVNITAATAGSTTAALSVTTSTLAGATVGSSYSASVSATGGTSPYTWTLISGSLPAGLSFSSSGVISGTPTTTTPSSFTVQVTDSASQSASATYSINISSTAPTAPATTTPATTTTPTATNTTTPTNSTATTAATTPATTAQTATVSASVLGSTGSFTVSGGNVSTATSLSSSNGSLSISLAANTAVNLQGSQNLTVIQLVTLPTPPPGSKTISAYACGPDNSTFSPALTVTIKYDPSSLPADVAESNLYIALSQNNNWSELNSTVNTSAKTVSAPISHFSTYALLGRTSTSAGTQATPPAMASFSTSDLTVSPASIKAGDMATVSVRVVNGGTAEASEAVILKINDQEEAQKNVTLAPGVSTTVSFNVSRSGPGSYKVSIDNQSDSFLVTAGSAGQVSDMSMPVIIIIAAGVLLVIFLVIILIMRQRSAG